MRAELLPLVEGPASPDDELVHGLADVLTDCVEGGASVGFIRPLALDRALEWWRTSLRAPGTRTWVARGGAGRVEGCVQLSLAGQDNARHAGRTRLMLDTQTGSVAERVYEGWGWTRVGVVQDYAASPDGVLAATTFMTKDLRA